MPKHGRSVSVEAEPKELATPTDFTNRALKQRLLDRFWRVLTEDDGVANDFDSCDALALQRVTDHSTNRFDLGQFGHCARL